MLFQKIIEKMEKMKPDDVGQVDKKWHPKRGADGSDSLASDLVCVLRCFFKVVFWLNDFSHQGQ